MHDNLNQARISNTISRQIYDARRSFYFKIYSRLFLVACTSVCRSVRPSLKAWSTPLIAIGLVRFLAKKFLSKKSILTIGRAPSDAPKITLRLKFFVSLLRNFSCNAENIVNKVRAKRCKQRIENQEIMGHSKVA